MMSCGRRRGAAVAVGVPVGVGVAEAAPPAACGWMGKRQGKGFAVGRAAVVCVGYLHFQACQSTARPALCWRSMAARSATLAWWQGAQRTHAAGVARHKTAADKGNDNVGGWNLSGVGQRHLKVQV